MRVYLFALQTNQQCFNKLKKIELVGEPWKGCGQSESEVIFFGQSHVGHQEAEDSMAPWVGPYDPWPHVERNNLHWVDHRNGTKRLCVTSVHGHGHLNPGHNS